MATKGTWKDPAKILPDEITKKRMEEILNHYPVLEQQGYEHSKEQLYWMLQWQFNNDTVNMLLSSGASSQDMDFLRLIIFLMGSSYVRDNYMNKDFCYEEVITKVRKDLAAGDAGELLQKLKNLEEQRAKLEASYEMDMKFLRQKFDSDKNLFEKDLTHAMEMNRIKEDFHMKEKGKLMEELTELRKEKEEYSARLKYLEAENSRIREIHHDQEKNMKTGFPMEIPKTRKGFWFSKLRRRQKDKKEKDLIYVRAVKDNGYSIDQLQFLKFATESGITLSELETLANPKIPLARMKLLCKLFFSRHGIEQPFPEEENEDESENASDSDHKITSFSEENEKDEREDVNEE